MIYTCAELHFHTKESSHCGEISAYDSIPVFHEHGYDLVCVTDHYNRDYFFDVYHNNQSWSDAMDAWFLGFRCAREAGEKCGVRVLHAAEFRFDDGPNDYLVYGMTDKMFYDYPRLYELPREEFSAFAHEHGLFFAQAHPFRSTQTRCDPALLDGLEVFNSHPNHEAHNELAAEHARVNGLIPICGQDYHQPAAMRDCMTRFFGKVDDMDTLVAKLFAREYEMILPGGEIRQAK